MAKLGFLGLGIMGYPMARNLLRAGHEVALWSHTASKAEELAAAEKGKFCATPKEVAENADCIFLCVGDTAMAEQVILGADGVIEGARSGAVVADASTISPSDSRKIGAALAKKGVALSRCALHRLHSRRQRRHLDLHGRWRSRPFWTKSGPGWKPWGRRFTIAAARAWACRPS